MMFLGAPRTFSYFQSGLTHARPARLGRPCARTSRATSAGSTGSGPPTTSPATRTCARAALPERVARHPARRRLGHELLPPVPARRAQRGGAVDRHLGAGPGARLRARAPPPRRARRSRSSSGARASSAACRCSPKGRAGSRTATACASPDWDLDVHAEPLVDAPAHALPIEYWTGPVRIAGRICGRPVSGLGLRRAEPALVPRLRAGARAAPDDRASGRSRPRRPRAGRLPRARGRGPGAARGSGLPRPSMRAGTFNRV